jgi:hypothetical protein
MLFVAADGKQQDQDFGSSTVSITLPSLETKIIPSFTL